MLAAGSKGKGVIAQGTHYRSGYMVKLIRRRNSAKEDQTCEEDLLSIQQKSNEKPKKEEKHKWKQVCQMKISYIRTEAIAIEEMTKLFHRYKSGEINEDNIYGERDKILEKYAIE